MIILYIIKEAIKSLHETPLSSYSPLESKPCSSLGQHCTADPVEAESSLGDMRTGI